MLRIAHEDGKIHSVPKIRMLKEPGARKGFLEIQKFGALIGALPGYLRPLVAFLYYCGVRKNEALSIDWVQVDLQHRFIVLEEEQTKNGEPRVIPLPNVLVALLKEIEPKVGLVFDGTNSAPNGRGLALLLVLVKWKNRPASRAGSGRNTPACWCMT
jgi:integrase